MRKSFLVLLLNFTICFVLSMAMPLAAEAHVKWFTDLKPDKETIAHIISPIFIILALLIAVLLAVLTQLLPALNSLKFMQWIDRELDKLRVNSILLLKYGLAIALLIQVLSGSLFVPEFELRTQFESILL